jgi:hypothetical protein
MPELRLSKLFMGLGSDLNSFPYVSPAFPFSIPRKPIADREREIGGRSKSVGNSEERKRETAIFVRPEMQKVVQKQQEMLAVPPRPVIEVEVCAICGNTQTIWGRCDCGTPGSAKGKVGSRLEDRAMPVRMERRPTKRIPKRGTTLRRIRKRVVRAFSI